MSKATLESMTFVVTQMDCAAEEQLVRMKLEGAEGVRHLAFDLDTRTLIVTHEGNAATVERLLQELNLGTSLIERQEVVEVPLDTNDVQQRQLLIIVLLINLGLFLLEAVTGFLAQSMGLVADSLDMLADAIVYGLSLYAVGKAVARKKQVAKLSGYFQVLLALFGLVEVARRFLGFGDEPTFSLMIGISLVAFAGNVASLIILRRTQSKDANIQASQIFTSNDVVVNIGVIVAGILVYFTGSNIPDLLVGGVIFMLVGYGAFRILSLSK